MVGRFDRTPSAYRTGKVSLLSGADEGLTIVRRWCPAAAMPGSFRDLQLVLRQDRACRGRASRSVVGVMDVVVTPRLYGGNVSVLVSLSSQLKADAVRVGGIVNSSSEGRPSSLVSRALRILLGVI